jgi:hypothetical protein
MFKEGRTSLPKWFIDKRIECKDSPVHGAGVFAVEDIPKHTIIESGPVLIIHKNSMDALFEINDHRHILQDYVFKWEPGFFAVAMGWVAVYNHDDNANCQWRPNFDYKSLEITTVKDVKSGDELFVKYLPAQLSALLWFEQDGKNESINDAREAMELARGRRSTVDFSKF